MSQIPTVVVVKGTEKIRINQADLTEWKAKGFNVPEPEPEPEADRSTPEKSPKKK